MQKKIEDVLAKTFDTRKSKQAVSHFAKCVEKFSVGDFETSLEKAGKTIEAITKLLCMYGSIALPTNSRTFKAGVYAEKVIQLPDSTLPNDSLRRQIPRACIFMYEIVSNRGGRHDSDGIEANEMDATITLYNLSWCLAELIRFSSRQSDNTKSKQLVEALVARKYPFVDEIEGRVHLDRSIFSGMIECALLILYHLDGKRVSKPELKRLLKMNGIKKESSIKMERLEPYIDVDNDGNIKLHKHGRKKAEEIIKKRS